MWASFFLIVSLFPTGCTPIADPDDGARMDDGPIADNISARLGEPRPDASAEQLETFQRGRAVFLKRFDRADGLGPAFNITFCGGCHERPVFGGSSGLYRNFVLSGRLATDGAFIEGTSAGMSGGVLRAFFYGDDGPARPAIPEDTTIFAQRNAIPMFGVGLMAELDDDVILANADPDDENGDGISGKANFDQGFVGRFGRKAQTVSIEGFIRGPFFNHLGITSNPLSVEQRMQLPVDSALAAAKHATNDRTISAQAAAPDGPSTDDDGVPDPELSSQDLFDVVSFAMLLAAPQLEEPSEQSNSGRLLFHEARCSDCHIPRLDGPRGPLPLYSDLLLHDMGDDLADGIVQKEATGSEFRTQPLWGLSAVGPYLHDGRAETITGAILAHGGEAQTSRDAFAAFSESQQADVIEFLLSLGGRDQFTTGLVPPDAPIPAEGEFAGPFRALSSDEQLRFLRGREVFDRDFGHDTGVGAMTGVDGGPRFNADSCRACHFDPVIGGAGPRGVNVMRHGSVDSDGTFSAPSTTPNTILHKQIRAGFTPPEPTSEINVFEHRQTPPIFGLGLVDAISEETIRSNEDPDDTNNDGISGRAHILADGRVGRLGWKAQVPSLAEFARDAMAAEIGLTLPEQEGLTFGLVADDDEQPDPELSLDEAEDLVFFMSLLAAPPRQDSASSEQAVAGETIFDTIGCGQCHIPSLPSDLGDVPLYSDLLLHEILPDEMPGIVDGDAGQREFRTAPLWGLSQTAPYFHTGEADTIDEAIRLHDAEAATVRNAYVALSQTDRDALIAFLQSL